MVAGDFNDIANSSEKKCETQVSAINFRERIKKCNLIEINTIGPKFSWNEPIYLGRKRIYEILEKALCNDE